MATLYDPAHVMPEYLVRVNDPGNTHYVVPPALSWTETWKWAREEFGAPTNERGYARWAVIPYRTDDHGMLKVETPDHPRSVAETSTSMQRLEQTRRLSGEERAQVLDIVRCHLGYIPHPKEPLPLTWFDGTELAALAAGATL